MKRAFALISLTSVLFVSALGGEIPTVGVSSPLPEEPTTTTAASPGDVPSVGYTDQMSDATLNLIHMMVGLVV